MDFSSVKLKPTKTKEKAAVLEVICKDSDDYKKLMEETYLETYLDALSDVTFPTVVISCLTKDLKQGHKEGWESSKNLQLLAKQIDVIMKEKAWETIFVRLSSRSPKDAALSVPKFSSLLQKHYARVCDREDRNEKLLALYGASTEAMGCENGAEAISLLCMSERIQDDLYTYEETNICVRKFASFLPELEVRGMRDIDCYFLNFMFSPF